MKALLWGVLGVIPFCVALGLGSQYFFEVGSLLEPTAISEASQGVSTSDQSVAIDINTSGINGGQPLPLSEIVPELERLAAVIPEAKNLTAQTPEQLHFLKWVAF